MPKVVLIQAKMTSYFDSWLGCMSYSIYVTGVGVESFVDQIFLAFGPGGPG